MEVEMPDGTILYDVPEGTTKEQLTAKVRGRFGTAPAPAPMNVDPAEGMPWYEKALVGAGAATARAGEGVLSLLDKAGLIDDEKRAELEQMKADRQIYEKHHPGGWATAGEVGGDIAMSALPVAKGGQLLTKALGKLGRFAPAAADVAANAAYSAATAPENRGTAAAFGGGGAAAGRVLTRTLGRAVRPSATGQELMNQGVRLTPGQAGEGVMGTVAKGYESAMGLVPGAAQIVDRAKGRALGDWNRVALSQAEVPGSVVKPSSIADLKAQYGAAYDKMLPEGIVAKLDPLTSRVYDDFTQRLGEKVAPTSRAKFFEVSEWIGHNLKQGVDASQFKEVVSNELDAAMNAAKRDGNRSLFTALKKLSDDLDKALPHFPGMPAEAAKLGATDKGYRAFKVLEKAGAKVGPLKREGVMYPSDLLTTATAKSHAQLQAEALRGHKAFGDAPSGLDKFVGRAGQLGALGTHVMTPETLAATLGANGVALLYTTEAGRKFLLGQIPWQAFARAHPDIAAQIGRALAQQGQPQPEGQ